MATNGIFYVNLGGSAGDTGAVRYGFRAPDKAYDDIKDPMGVVKVEDTSQGVLFGVSRPRPAKVSISYKKGTNLGSRAIKRFCEPDKVGDVTVGGAINGKKVTVGASSYDINYVTLLGR